MQTPNTSPSFRCPRDCGTAAAATTAAVQSVKTVTRQVVAVAVAVAVAKSVARVWCLGAIKAFRNA